MKLSTRLAVAVGVTVPLLVLASGVLLLRLMTKDAKSEVDAHLQARAAVVVPIARNVLRVRRTGREVLAQTRERRLFSAALDVGVRVVAGGGASAGGGSVAAEGGPQPPDSVTLPLVGQAASPVTVSYGGQSWRALALPVRGGQAGDAVWVFAPESAVDDGVAAVRRRVFVIALIAAPASALLALAIAERATLPLRRLQRRASGLDPRVSTARLEHTPSRVTEVDDLAHTLQTILARYDEQAARTREALETARSFSAAASHELRTPLMSMRTNLEILAAHPGLDAAERAEAVADLQAEHARLQGLLVTLRALAQGDLVEADSFAPVDLGELLEASAADAARRHPRDRITVHASAGLRTSGWEPGLRMVTDNLLANALVHGRTPGTGTAAVEVVLSARQGGALLTVDDHGPGIPPHAREQVFQRFERGAGSPGTGLGLTLVAQQVALHSGTVGITGRPDGLPGTRFEVRLPLTGGTGTATLELPRHRDWLTGSLPRPRA